MHHILPGPLSEFNIPSNYIALYRTSHYSHFTISGSCDNPEPRVPFAGHCDNETGWIRAQLVFQSEWRAKTALGCILLGPQSIFTRYHHKSQDNLSLPWLTCSQKSTGSVTFLFQTPLSNLQVCSLPSVALHFLLSVLLRAIKPAPINQKTKHKPGEPIYSSHLTLIT